MQDVQQDRASGGRGGAALGARPLLSTRIWHFASYGEADDEGDPLPDYVSAG